jgi:uncharacterized membrane protein (DUF485 family)
MQVRRKNTRLETQYHALEDAEHVIAVEEVQDDVGAPDARLVSYDHTPDVRELRHRQRWFVFPMTVVFLGWYFLLIYGAGHWPSLFEKQVYGNITLGYVLAVSQFFTTFLIAFVYARYAVRRLDPLAGHIRERLVAPEPGAPAIPEPVEAVR